MTLRATPADKNTLLPPHTRAIYIPIPISLHPQPPRLINRNGKSGASLDSPEKHPKPTIAEVLARNNSPDSCPLYDEHIFNEPYSDCIRDDINKRHEERLKALHQELLEEEERLEALLKKKEENQNKVKKLGRRKEKKKEREKEEKEKEGEDGPSVSALRRIGIGTYPWTRNRKGIVIFLTEVDPCGGSTSVTFRGAMIKLRDYDNGPRAR